MAKLTQEQINECKIHSVTVIDNRTLPKTYRVVVLDIENKFYILKVKIENVSEIKDKVNSQLLLTDKKVYSEPVKKYSGINSDSVIGKTLSEI